MYYKSWVTCTVTVIVRGLQTQTPRCWRETVSSRRVCRCDPQVRRWHRLHFAQPRVHQQHLSWTLGCRDRQGLDLLLKTWVLYTVRVTTVEIPIDKNLLSTINKNAYWWAFFKSFGYHSTIDKTTLLSTNNWWRDLSYQLLITNKIWNLTNEIHLTLTEWKRIPYIFPIRTTVRMGRGQEDRILTNHVHVQQYTWSEDKRIGSSWTTFTRMLWCRLNRQSERKGLWEWVQRQTLSHIVTTWGSRFSFTGM